MMQALRRTKIVVTMGPSLDDVSMLEQVILSGGVIFRANFSLSKTNAITANLQARTIGCSPGDNVPGRNKDYFQKS